jgi:hypothetical protein
LAGRKLDSGNCVQAAAVSASVLQMLGFKENLDYLTISTNLHVHIYVPSTDQILDPTIAQFFLHTPEKAKEVAEKRGFIGNKKELLNFFKENFGPNAEGIARTGWRFSNESNSYLTLTPPQESAAIASRNLSEDILRESPITSEGTALRTALLVVLKDCDDMKPRATEVNCTHDLLKDLNVSDHQEILLNKHFLKFFNP